MSSTPASKAANRSSKQSRMVILRLRPELLAKFAASSPSSDQPASDNASSPVDGTDAASQGTPRPGDNNLDVDSTKKKSGAKSGIKRNASSAALDANRPKGKPGPKKKPRNADGSIDRSQDTPRPTVAATGAAPKLGPKANTGAINAGLRALDRSGKPCRKWGRKGFNLKSFTGVTWDVNSWRAPVRSSLAPEGEGKSDDSSMGDNKPRIESSAVPSESSRGGDAPGQHMTGIASSPAPIAV